MSEQTALVSKKLLEKATQTQKLIVTLWTSFKRKPMALGIVIAKARKQNLWSVLNYESENAWREHLDIGRSTWFRSGGIAEKLMAAGVPEKELLKMTIDNAEILLNLPGRQLKNPKWWRLAQEKKACELAELVEKALPAGAEEKADAATVERRVKLELHLYDTQRTAILEAVKEFNREHGIPLDDVGRGLELMVAEVRGNRQSVVRAIRNVLLPNMRKFLEAHGNGNGNGKEQVSVEEQLELAFDVMRKTLEGLAAVTQ